ncbi:aldehyde ferredoxin oxidoreductase family protein [Chloroflexota bacterium]
MLGGYAGKLLRINLSKGTINEEALPVEDVLRRFVGGTGLAVKMLMDELGPNVKPFDAENPVIFMNGPLTGTPMPCASDMTVVTLHADMGNAIGDSHTHGYFGAYLKFNGFDGVIIEGKSKTPVYIWIHDGHAEIQDASKFWGLDTHDTEDAIKDDLGAQGFNALSMSVAAIGPAGENLVRGAGIFNDKHHCVGKGSPGAVLGSKKVKAIAVESGTFRLGLADPKATLEVAKKWRDDIMAAPYHMSFRGGVAFLYDKKIGDKDLMACHNMSRPVIGRKLCKDFVEEAKKWEITAVGCWSCPIACAYRADITTGPHRGFAATLGGGGENREGPAAMVDVMDPGTGNYLAELIDRLGIEAAPVGASLGWAFECYERGILTKKDTDGLELRWGDAETVEKLIRKMAYREGFGDLLAKGAKEAAKIIGGDAMKYAIYIKDSEPNMHDWRPKWGVLMGQITASAGPCWQGSLPDFIPLNYAGITKVPEPFKAEGLMDVVRKAQIPRVWEDCIGECWFGTTWPQNAHYYIPEAIATVVGWEDFTFEEGMMVGERVMTMEHLFATNRGLTLADDLDVCDKLLDPATEGLAKGKSIRPYLKDLVQEYYELMGWERETGVPTQKTLKRLGLGEYVPSKSSKVA